MKTENSRYRILHNTALGAPRSSGVYLWKDGEQTVLYVGKAKNLKNRLASYFSGQKDIKTRILVSKAYSIEYITTANEYEALILENTLIKQYRPRYNIDLKDDKSYPVARSQRRSTQYVYRYAWQHIPAASMQKDAPQTQSLYVLSYRPLCRSMLRKNRQTNL